jgi:hypothetical protein
MKRKRMETAVVWLLVIGPLLIGIGAAIYWGSGNNTVGLWAGFFPGAIALVLAATLQVQTIISKSQIAETPPLNETEVKKARAYVFIDTIKTKNIDDNISVTAPDLIGHILVVVKNTGQTPAFKFTHHAAIRLAAWPPPDGLFNLPEVAPNSRDTLPSGGFAQITVSLGRHLNVDEKTVLGLGIQAVYLFGEIGYDDVFGIKRCTHYRYRVGGDIGFNGSSMAPMTEGNEVDQNCS